jgi:hypothetical protein
MKKFLPATLFLIAFSLVLHALAIWLWWLSGAPFARGEGAAFVEAFVLVLSSVGIPVWQEIKGE